MTRLSVLLESDRPLVMGILNVTPDSFSDGGKFLNLGKALSRAHRMAKDGADIIDVGGESTRPGATNVGTQLECDRVIPVIEAIRSEMEVPLSCDTSKPEVMRIAAAAGIDMINDVRALRREGALEYASLSKLPVCLMHMQGEPDTMQKNPVYENLSLEIRHFFEERIAACIASGIERDKLILDVGFGFGKLPEHNLTLVNRLNSFLDFDLPLLVGISRKTTIGQIVNDRLTGSLVAGLIALERGAKIIRVHDVAETAAAVRVWRSIQAEKIIDE